jgi:hypothetical protein
MIRPLLASIILSIGLAAPDDGYAWGRAGHEIVCDLAYRLLSEPGRRLVDEIRAEGGLDEPQYFYQTCLWPDEVRRGPFAGSYRYHFADVADAAPGYDLARDCAALDCAPVAIQRFATIVARDPAGSRTGRKDRAEALRFLGHFVADVHQPLHVGQAEDRGGNALRVAWFGDRGSPGNPMHLHRVWDTGILTSAGYKNVGDARPLLAEIDRRDVTAWREFDVVGWTRQSRALAETRAYRHPDGAPVLSGDDLGERYFEAAGPVVETRLMRAAVRLAYLIDAAASGSLPRNMVVACPTRDGEAACGSPE